MSKSRTSLSSSSPVWHPFTQHAVHPDAIEIASADGAWITSSDGRRIFDGISSWWVITHGHRHPEIVDAIQRQSEALDQVIFAGFTHKPAEELAKRLISRVPGDLTRVFYSDSGSTAVEVAIKMALGFWHNQGVSRDKLICLSHAYHGDTVGTMSAGARGVFNQAYAPLLYDVTHLPFPDPESEDATLAACEAACGKGDVAALLVEPLLLGAGGMKTYGADTLRALYEICRKHDVLVIADEVMTGWGRTGRCFASDAADISPDILCLAKGLTGGSVPLAVTLAREDIFTAHFSTDRSKTFFHSSSFTANPICCAAALANLEIWDTEPVLERIQALSDMQEACLKQLQDHAQLKNLRQIGTVTAMEFHAKSSDYLSELGPKLYERFLANDVLLRPLGNTIYVMPPYCTTEPELQRVYDVIRGVVEEVA